MPVALIKTIIGQTVDYYRVMPNSDTKQNEFVEGRGVALSVHLNPDLRPMVQIKDGDKTLNIDAAMINASEEQKAQYRLMIETVDKLCAEVDAKQMELITDYNRMIEAAYLNCLGAPIDITEKKPESVC